MQSHFAVQVICNNYFTPSSTLSSVSTILSLFYLPQLASSYLSSPLTTVILSTFAIMCLPYHACQRPCMNVQYAQVYRVQWSLGLNPYNLYQECYGGAPDSRGVIRETENEVDVIVPELALHMDDEQLEQYYKVCVTIYSCVRLFPQSVQNMHFYADFNFNILTELCTTYTE